MHYEAVVRTLADVDWASFRAVDEATLLFVLRGDEVLLIRKKRGLGAGKINGPGGRLEPAEAPADGALREAREEVGVVARSPTGHGELFFQFVDGYSIHVHVFCATAFEGEPVETEEATPLWFPVAALPFAEMWADDELWLPHVLAGGSVRGRFLFEGDRMLDHALERSPVTTSSR